MSAIHIEALLARLYTDANYRAQFQTDPRAVALVAGLSEDEAADLARLDWAGLKLVVASIQAKRRAP